MWELVSRPRIIDNIVISLSIENTYTHKERKERTDNNTKEVEVDSCAAVVMDLYGVHVHGKD